MNIFFFWKNIVYNDLINSVLVGSVILNIYIYIFMNIRSLLRNKFQFHEQLQSKWRIKNIYLVVFKIAFSMFVLNLLPLSVFAPELPDGSWGKIVTQYRFNRTYVQGATASCSG